LSEHRQFDAWKIEKVAITPQLDAQVRTNIRERGFIAQDLRDLTAGL
jgi:hypothetical protein